MQLTLFWIPVLSREREGHWHLIELNALSCKSMRMIVREWSFLDWTFLLIERKYQPKRLHFCTTSSTRRLGLKLSWRRASIRLNWIDVRQASIRFDVHFIWSQFQMSLNAVQYLRHFLLGLLILRVPNWASILWCPVGEFLWDRY